jgi:hypothetical protein
MLALAIGLAQHQRQRRQRETQHDGSDSELLIESLKMTSCSFRLPKTTEPYGARHEAVPYSQACKSGLNLYLPLMHRVH